MAPSAITPTEEYHLSYKDLQSIDSNLGSTVDYGAGKAKQLIGDALKSRVEAIDQDTCGAGEEDAFFVGDLGEVYRQHMRWKKNLGRVKPHYGECRIYSHGGNMLMCE
jgi:ornithine decarboxylase